MKPTTVKAYLKLLKVLSEETLIGEMKGSEKLTKQEEHDLRAIIAGIQNEVGELDEEIWKKFNVKPYDGSL